MRNLFSFLAKLLFSLVYTLVLIEGGMRLFPQVVPLELLIYFAENPRAEIANRRNLPTTWGTVVVERDDGGPELDKSLVQQPASTSDPHHSRL
jgi:hypothetical protein